MIINDIGLKNFKSYGNNMQKVYFNEGELILLSGDNESGKSTLIDLISAYHFANSGEVLIDSHDIKTLNLRTLRQSIEAI